MIGLNSLTVDHVECRRPGGRFRLLPPDGMPALGVALCAAFVLILYRWGRRAGSGSGFGPGRS